jgi:hypothetical protein
MALVRAIVKMGGGWVGADGSLSPLKSLAIKSLLRDLCGTAIYKDKRGPQQ